MIGRTIAKYRILAPLGSGGMGDVYLAQDEQLGRRVAIKVLDPALATQPQRLERFRHEARAVAALNHPHVVHIYEAGVHEGVPYIVMEHVEGTTLAARMNQGDLEVGEVIAIAVQIADALAEGHRKGIVHRDIKPANVMLDHRNCVKVLDFGLAKVIHAESDGAVFPETEPHTATGAVLGTFPYMSPEQALGKKVGAQSDVFSFGTVLYEMLTGHRPFGGGSNAEVAHNIVTQIPHPTARYNASVPPELERITRKCLEKPAERRYATAGDLAVDLRALQGDLSGIASAPTVSAAPLPVRSRRTFIGVTAAIVAVVLATVLVWQRVPSRGVVEPQQTIRSVAVLPFVAETSGTDAQLLPEALTDTLIRRLSTVSRLRVMSRNSVSRFAGKRRDAQAAAKELGVDAVIAGTVSRAGDDTVVSAEVIDARDGSVLLSRRYDAPADDVMTLLGTVAQDVAENLRLRLNGEEQAHLLRQETSNAEAYRNRLLGAMQARQIAPPSLHRAIGYYKKAVELDPDYSLAWSEMARAYLLLGLYFENPKEMMPLAKAYAYKALQLDNASTDAHVNLGVTILMFDWDRRAAQRELLSTAGLAVGTLDTFGCASHLLQTAGRARDAEKDLRIALATDPLSPVLNAELGCNSYYQRRFDVAIGEYRRALEIDPSNVFARWGLGRALGQKAMYAEAVAEMQSAKPAPPVIVSEIGYAMARAGKTREAKKMLEQLAEGAKQNWVDPFLSAIIYTGLGDDEQTFAWMNRAVDARSAFMPSLATDPKFDELRKDRRYAALMERTGL